MSQVDQLAAQAAQWQAAGRPDMAVQLYQAALEQDPSKYGLRMQLAECLAYLQQPEAAAEQYLMVAQAYAARGHQTECMAICDRLLTIAPQSFVYMSVGPMVRRIGRLARPLCARAAELHLQAGRQTDGLQMLRLGAELDPHNPDVRRQLARIYQGRHMKREAVEALLDAANLLLQAKRHEDFVEVAQQILALEPGEVGTLRELPRVYLDLRRPHDAVRALSQLTRASPGDIIGYEILAQAFASIGRVEKSLLVLERLVEELGRSGKADLADAILHHARYWRPTDLGFQRSIKRIVVPQARPVTPQTTPPPPSPEGTVVLSIADLMVEESRRAANPMEDSEVVRLTEAEGTLSLCLDDLIVDGMAQAAGFEVPAKPQPQRASAPPQPQRASAPPPPPPRRPPPAAEVENVNATMALDASDLIEALADGSFAEVRPSAVKEEAVTAVPPSRVQTQERPTASPSAGHPPETTLDIEGEPATTAFELPPGGLDALMRRPSTVETQTDSDPVYPSSSPPPSTIQTRTDTGPIAGGGPRPPSAVQTLTDTGPVRAPSSPPPSAIQTEPDRVARPGGPEPTVSLTAKTNISELIYDDEDEEREADDEPATMLHMKKLTAEDILRAQQQMQQRATAPASTGPSDLDAPTLSSAAAERDDLDAPTLGPMQSPAGRHDDLDAPTLGPVSRRGSSHPYEDSDGPTLGPRPSPFHANEDGPTLAGQMESPAVGDDAPTMAHMQALTPEDIARALRQQSASTPQPSHPPQVDEEDVTRPPHRPTAPAAAPAPSEPTPPAPVPPPLLTTTPPAAIDIDDDERTTAMQALTPEDIARYQQQLIKKRDAD